MTLPLADTETAYAKINLALHVRRRREDGYHDIESLFAFAEHGDEITAALRHDGVLTLTIEGPFARGLDAGPDNLVLLAASALRERAGQNAGADIRLIKNLPVASGIGGGSADAAATLRLLARSWSLEIDMMDIAATLGSDVPACLVSRTSMGTGRGEALDLREIEGSAGMPLLLVNPAVALSTATVFSKWDGMDRGPLSASDIPAVVADGRNDLYPPAAALVPEIAKVVAWLSAQPDVRLARMSGSGATCFALFDTPGARDAAAAGMPSSWWKMSTRIRSI